MTDFYCFLRVYNDISKGTLDVEELKEMYCDLQKAFHNNIYVGHYFGKLHPTFDMMIKSFDAIVDNISNKGQLALDTMFNGNIKDFKHYISNDVNFSILQENKLNGLSSLDDMVFLEKQQVGMATKEDIASAIKEYEQLYQAGIASPGEILTLFRYYGHNSKYAKEIQRQRLDLEENEPLIVGGPASVAVVDKEGHLITAKALADAFPKFMKNVRARNAHAFHSDVQVGWIMPAYITRSGRIFKSGVNKNGLWVISELRNDIRVAKRLAEEIINGKIRSYSIAGSAIDTQFVTEGSRSYMRVDELEIVEITYCEEGVNQAAHFNILKSNDTKIKYDIEDINRMLPNDFNRLDLLFFDGNNSILVKDSFDTTFNFNKMQLDLRQYVPDSVIIKQQNQIPLDSFSLCKNQGLGYYSQLIHNYPELNNLYFCQYLSECTGVNSEQFNELERSTIENAAQEWLRDKRAFLPEFSTAYFQKEMDLHSVAPELANAIDGYLFIQKMDNNIAEVYQDANYRPADVEEEDVKDCEVCKFFDEGFCDKLEVPVVAEYTCDHFEPRESTKFIGLSLSLKKEK